MRIENISSYNNKVYNKPAFKEYRTTLYNAVRNDIKDVNSAEKLFDTLIKEVCEEPDIHKNPVFKVISHVYEKSGFKGLLEELRQPNKGGIIQNTLDKCEYDFAQIITQKGQPLFELFNFGKFCTSKNAPNDIKVIFRDPAQKECLEFNLGEKLNLNIGRSDGYTTVDTEYYVKTGTPKTVVENSGGNQTRTFYNEDGSKPFFKNLFFGGTAVNI